MAFLMFAAIALFVGFGASAASASEYIADSSEEHHVPVVVRDFFFGRDAAERAMRTDLEYTQMMARHHQGAVDMAVYYLNDARGTNPVIRRLSRSIIHNQDFEIAVLDVIRTHVGVGPQPVGLLGLVSLPRGFDGLEHVWQFTRAGTPSIVDIWLSPGLRVSDFDVQFARPMIEHHSAAVTWRCATTATPTVATASSAQ